MISRWRSRWLRVDAGQTGSSVARRGRPLTAAAVPPRPCHSIHLSNSQRYAARGLLNSGAGPRPFPFFLLPRGRGKWSAGRRRGARRHPDGPCEVRRAPWLRRAHPRLSHGGAAPPGAPFRIARTGTTFFPDRRRGSRACPNLRKFSAESGSSRCVFMLCSIRTDCQARIRKAMCSAVSYEDCRLHVARLDALCAPAGEKRPGT